MEIQLQELIDQIKKDGVEAAENEAESILNDAKAQAEKIIADAQMQADKILADANVDVNKKAEDLTNEEIARIRDEVNKYQTEGELRREINMNIKTKMEINSYQGTRHKKGLPVRGQRTNRNARTRKGKGKVVANKKK